MWNWIQYEIGFKKSFVTTCLYVFFPNIYICYRAKVFPSWHFLVLSLATTFEIRTKGCWHHFCLQHFIMNKFPIKTALIITYIITILVISGLARAAVFVDNFSIDQKLNKLSVTGRVTDQCSPTLSVQLAKPSFFEGEDLTDNSKNGLVRLVVVNGNKSEKCSESGNSVLTFDLIADLKGLGIPTESFSKISVEGSDYSKMNLVWIDENSICFTGLIVQMADGSFAVVDNNRRFFNLRSSIDLSKYNGETVLISGYEYLHQLEPILEVDSHDPLTEMAKKNGPEMFVMSISSLPLER